MGLVLYIFNGVLKATKFVSYIAPVVSVVQSRGYARTPLKKMLWAENKCYTLDNEK